MKKLNDDIRQYIRSNDLFLYQVAEKLNYKDYKFSRILRNELSNSQRQRIYDAVESLTAQRKREDEKWQVKDVTQSRSPKVMTF